MITIILNIIGLILIIYSIYIIRKDLTNHNTTVNDLNQIEERVKEYYNLTEEIIEEFDEIIDSKLEMINKKNEKIHNEQLNSIIISDNNLLSNDSSNMVSINSSSIHKNVVELKKIGLTNEEIAKKLNKGIREVEIILKMYENIKSLH